jgi:hypothetical protein
MALATHAATREFGVPQKNDEFEAMLTRAADWQARLERHFGALAERRSSGRAVFALEHGLDADELADLQVVVGATARSPFELDGHWLPLVVHAAEIAYGYAGDEYWPSFRANTPGWNDSPEARHEVREACQWFAKTYRGPTPQGRWAEWFSIICWPITNALLPTDLQRHLARALWLSRAGLATRLGDIDELGRFIAASGWEGSDRFAQLREQPTLLGQVALALLRPREVSDSLIFGQTLRRIAADLERERAAATFLRGARQSVDRTRITPAGRPRSALGEGDAALERRVEAAARLDAPRLTVQPSRSRTEVWEVWLRLPNLASVAASSPLVRDGLLASRCWVPASDARVAPGQMLFDDQAVPLARWPEEGVPLVRFQGLAEGLESALLRAWMGPSIPAVFALGPDGRGTYLATGTVRPGRAYVVGRLAPLDRYQRLQVATSCTGVLLYRVAIPDAVSEEMQAFLEGLGLHVTRTSSVWPAGSIPTQWDGEGYAQWQAADAPILGLQPDHDLRELHVRLAEYGAVGTRVSAGQRVFLPLPHLATGRHEIRISETDLNGATATRSFTFEITDEAPAAVETEGPIRVWTDPHSRNLEDLWEGRIAVRLAGPAVPLTLRISLTTRTWLPPLAVRERELTAPLSAEGWRELVRGLLENDEELATAYGDARFGAVEIDAGRYGSYRLDFDRSLPPLRWRFEGLGRGGRLVLYDDTEAPVPPTVKFARFERPDVFTVLQLTSMAEATVVDPEGGLYVASRPSERPALAVVGPPMRLSSFQALGLETTVDPVARTARAVGCTLEMLGLWARASLAGTAIGRAWRATVVHALHATLMGVVCGTRWLEAEDRFRDGRLALGSLADELSRGTSAASYLAASIAREGPGVRMWSDERRIEELARLLQAANLHAGAAWPRVLAARNGAAHDWAAEFCLRLATDPECAFWSNDATDAGIELVLAWALPVRAARFLVLASGTGEGGGDYPPLFEGQARR